MMSNYLPPVRDCVMCWSGTKRGEGQMELVPIGPLSADRHRVTAAERDAHLKKPAKKKPAKETPRPRGRKKPQPEDAPADGDLTVE
jgi:hypothetical protein